MNGIISWFARNSVAANLLMIVAFIGGIVGYNRMEQKMFPVVPVAGASVSVVWQGASPQDVEEQIITRIEAVVADIDGLERITSVANEGFGVVNIRGRDDIDMLEFLDEIKLRVDQINNLPLAAFRPQVTRWEQRNWYMGMVLHGNTDARTMKRLAKRVRDDIANISGGQLAVMQAVLDEEVSIEVSEDALRRYGLSFSDVANAIRVSSINSSGGRIESATGDVSITSRNLADTEAQFENIIIRQSTDQGTIRVGDVANVIDGSIDANLHASFEKDRAAFVMIPSPDKMQIVGYTDAMKEYVARANNPNNGILPEAMKIDFLWDDSVSFKARMNLIGQSAMLGAVLVLLVLILFLHPIVAFWVTIGIITAFAGGIMLLPYLGVSWNVLSTFAVLLVIGVVVDDAIIVGENIHKEVETGRREGADAAIVGTQLVTKPVIFGVLTTIIAFMPWLFITGPIRSFTQQISLVVVAALIFSIIECMLILPAHLKHLKHQPNQKLGLLARFQRRIADSLVWFANHIYKPLLEAAIRFRYATVVFFFSLLFLTTQIAWLGIVPFKFMPEIEGDLIQVTIDLPDGTPFSRTMQIRDRLENSVDVLTAEMKEKYPDLENGLIDGSSIVATDARIQAWVGMVAPEERPETIKTRDISARFREIMGPIQDAEEVSFDFTLNDEQSGIRFALNHESDLDRLRDAASYVKAHLATYGSAYDIGDNLSSAADEIQISMRPGAEALGVTLADVSNQIRQAYFGVEVQRLPRDGEDVRVMVRYPKEDRKNLDSIRNLRIRTVDGREIPINQVAEFHFAPGINRIVRRNRMRSVTVRAEVRGDGGRGEIMKAMEEAKFWEDFERQFPDVERQQAGGFEQQQEFFAELLLLGGFALGAMYILLAIAFSSYVQPFLLLTALPFAYCGAVFGHWAFGIDMAMFSIFGIIAAAGVVINDNLVLLDFVNRRREEGAGAVQALVDAGVSRFRPILLTSVTTFVGVLPLIAERSVQAQFLKPMVISLGCAVAFALFVSLLLVPALYAVGVEVGRFFKWFYNGKPRQSIGTSYSGDIQSDQINAPESKPDTPAEWDGVGAPAE